MYRTDILFECHAKVVVGQEKFLSNEHNKTRFISQLSGRLTENDISVKQATDDADSLIIQTAVHESINATDRDIVVGEDVDLLVLMIAWTPLDRNLIFMKPGRGRLPARQYSSSELQNFLGSLRDCILFLHAASGCDTVPSCFGQGKHNSCSDFYRIEKN